MFKNAMTLTPPTTASPNPIKKINSLNIIDRVPPVLIQIMITAACPDPFLPLI